MSIRKMFEIGGVVAAFMGASLFAQEGEGENGEVPSEPVREGWTMMSYRPPAGLAEYLWTSGDYWYATPAREDSTPLGYVPTAIDDVRLYSSKNVAVPLRVPSGVNAETRDLVIGTADGSGNYQSFVVESGATITNHGNVTFGGVAAWDDTAAHVRLAGEWNAHGMTRLGQSKNGSTLTIDEGGTFISTNKFAESNLGDNEISILLLGNVKTSAENIITNRGTMHLQDVHFGSAANSRGVIENFGVMNVSRKLTVGRSGYGRLHLHPGSTLNKQYTQAKPVLIANSANSEGELICETDVALKSGDYIRVAVGKKANGTLRLRNSAITLNGQVEMGVGESSQSLVELGGESSITFSSARDWKMSNGSQSTSRVTLRDDSKLDGLRLQAIPMSAAATGIVEMLDRSVITNVANRMVNLAPNDDSYGRFVVGGESYIGSLTNLSLCAVSANAAADLEMRGGTVGFKGGGGGVWSLFVGNADQTETRARIRGWGRFIRANDETYNMLRLTTHGQFIADGEGEARDLDFSHFRTVGRGSGDDTNVTGSNGWYAVSGGRLVYPRIQDISGNSHRVIGDYPNREKPQLVNSMRFTMTTYPSEVNYHAYAALYASDRGDVPQGLAADRGAIVKGVWRLGFSEGSAFAAEQTPVNFAGLTLQIRYDADGLDEEHNVYVFHHDGTASGKWCRVAEKKAFDPADPYVTTATPVGPSVGEWNAGWFAIVARKPSKGMAIIIR